jgi:hypothetical protein
MENEILDSAQIALDEDRAEEITFDAEGRPVGCYTVEQVFDELDRELIAHYGERGRRLANQERMEWNTRYPGWHFDML